MEEKGVENSKPKNLGGRPPKDKYNLEDIINKIINYTNTTEIPIFKECCFLNDWCTDYIYQLSQKEAKLSSAIKRLRERKESQLEKLALTGQVDKTMAVFSLKQLGWRDRQDIALDTTDNRKQMDKYLEVVKNGTQEN